MKQSYSHCQQRKKISLAVLTRPAVPKEGGADEPFIHRIFPALPDGCSCMFVTLAPSTKRRRLASCGTCAACMREDCGEWYGACDPRCRSSAPCKTLRLPPLRKRPSPKIRMRSCSQDGASTALTSPNLAAMVRPALSRISVSSAHVPPTRFTLSLWRRHPQAVLPVQTVQPAARRDGWRAAATTQRGPC